MQNILRCGVLLCVAYLSGADAEETDPHTYFREIAEELRTTYEAGYYPANRAKDGTFRKIVIKTKAEGVRVRAKTGYFAR
jgi:hypothetical protein